MILALKYSYNLNYCSFRFLHHQLISPTYSNSNGTGVPCFLFTIAITLYRVPIPMGACSLGPSQKGASSSPTRRQYPVFRDSACSSVQFCSKASILKLMPRAPRNLDWVIGPWMDTSSAKGFTI